MEANPDQKLLILDLDETLIYAQAEALTGRSHDLKVGPYFVYKRVLSKISSGLLNGYESSAVEVERFAMWVFRGRESRGATTGEAPSWISRMIKTRCSPR